MAEIDEFQTLLLGRKNVNEKKGDFKSLPVDISALVVKENNNCPSAESPLLPHYKIPLSQNSLDTFSAHNGSNRLLTFDYQRESPTLDEVSLKFKNWISTVKSSISKENESIKTLKEEFKKLQDEKNLLEYEIDQKDLKIIELEAQVNDLKKSKSVKRVLFHAKFQDKNAVNHEKIENKNNNEENSTVINEHVEKFAKLFNKFEEEKLNWENEKQLMNERLAESEKMIEELRNSQESQKNSQNNNIVIQINENNNQILSSETIENDQKATKIQELKCLIDQYVMELNSDYEEKLKILQIHELNVTELKEEINELNNKLEICNNNKENKLKILHFKLNPMYEAEVELEKKYKNLETQIYKLKSLLATYENNNGETLLKLKENHDKEIEKLKKDHENYLRKYNYVIYCLFGWSIKRSSKLNDVYKLYSCYNNKSPNDYFKFKIELNHDLTLYYNKLSEKFSDYAENYILLKKNVPLFLNAVQLELYNENFIDC